MRVVIINADPVSRDLLEFVLRNAGFETAIVGGSQVFLETNIFDADAVIVRGNESVAEGCQRCMQLRARRYSGPVIFVGRQTAMRDKVRVFEHGADDYVVEPFDPVELVSRVNAVFRRSHQGECDDRENELRVGDFELSMGSLSVRVGNREPVTLTPTEMRLLECLLRNPKITVSRETLIERTWGDDFVGSGNRLDVNILRLRKKLEVDSTNPRYLLAVRGVGYVILPSVPDESLDNTGPMGELGVGHDVEAIT